MDKTGKRTLLWPVVLGLSVMALGAAALVMGWWPGATQPASAGPAGLDMAMGVSGQCDSTAGPAKCTFDPGTAFTVEFKINSIPGGFTYGAYGMDIVYSGNVSYVTGSLVQTGAGMWPSCTFATAEAGFTPGDALTGCTIGPGAVESTYLGTLAKLNFQCGASAGPGVLTLAMGPGKTEVLDASLIGHSEAVDEELTVNCGAGEPPTNTPPPEPTVTPTPCDGPCPTATATNTVPPPPTATATNTPSPKACGDVNDDGNINPVDATLILQHAAGLLGTLANAPSADVNDDGAVNPVDATLILQHAAGLVPASGLHCP